MSGHSFVHLHNHSMYSLLDGGQRIDAMLERVAEMDMPAVALTDHGNLFGAVEFHDKARAHGIKPILGCEVYVAPGDRRDRSPVAGRTKPYYHMLLLARNETGWKNLIQLVSRAYTEGFYYKPRIDREILSEHAGGLIGTSACVAGELCALLAAGRDGEAEEAAAFHRDVLGPGNYYVEIQDQGLPIQQELNPKLIRLARRMDLPLVATNDVHFATRADHSAHDALICIQTGTTLDDPDRITYAAGHYFKSPEEMAAVFGDIPEAMRSTLEIAEACDVTLPSGQSFLPDFGVPEGYTQETYFRKVVEEGFKKRTVRWEHTARRETLQGTVEDRRRRLEHEIDVISRAGYTGYFLIVWDFIRYAREEGISVGPGRGSAAGSIVAYCMGITDVDPIQYGLLFERFLNPDRLAPPDIDIDFCQRGRGRVIDYVTRKYGRENVAQIITFGAMNAKQVLRDVGRVMDFPFAEADRIAKLIPDTPGTTLKDALKSEPRLPEMMQNDPRVERLVETGQRLEGLVRHASVHAAGVVITPRPLTEFVPLYKTNRDEITTQWAKDDVERIGLLKVDMLGLRTLTVLSDALLSIEAESGERLDLDHLPLDVKEIDDEEMQRKVRETYRLFAESRTLGIFQFESSGMRDILRRLQPASFEDLIALNALYRPGPIDAGLIDEFIKSRKDPKGVRYALPELEEVLRPTYGVTVYQEQVMNISRILAGFTMSEADILRKAMGKKKKGVMAAQKQKFIEGCKERDLPAGPVRELWDQLEKFARYCFNRSHSTAYAQVAYQTAWLKVHHPRHFMAALLTSEREHTDKVVRYIAEAAAMGIRVLPPDINDSGLDFTATRESIRFGLSAIKGVGELAVESVLEARGRVGRFESFYQFVEEIDLRLCNRKVLESLIKAGCFDTLGYRRSQLFAAAEPAMEHAGKMQADRASGQSSLFDEMMPGQTPRSREYLPAVSDWSDREMLAYEKETLGYYLTSHPLKEHEELVGKLSSATIGVLEEKVGQEVSICGVLTRGKRVRTRKGEMMYRSWLEDWEGSAELVVFPKTYKECHPLCVDDTLVFVTGRVESDGTTLKILASEVQPLEDARTRTARRVVLHVPLEELDDERVFQAEALVRNHRGEVPLRFQVEAADGRCLTIKAGLRKKVAATPDLRSRFEEIFGKGSVEYLY